MRRGLWLAAVLPLLLAADSPDGKAVRLRVRRDAAVQQATDAFWHARLVADRAYLDGLTFQLKSSPNDDTLKQARQQAEADVAVDADSLKSHTGLTSMDGAIARLRDVERKRDMTPAAAKAISEHRLEAGLTLDQANEAMGTEGKQSGGDANGQVYEWTLSHDVPFEPPATGDDQRDLLNARAAAANHLKTRVVDAVWTGHFEAGRLVSFAKR